MIPPSACAEPCFHLVIKPLLRVPTFLLIVVLLQPDSHHRELPNTIRAVSRCHAGPLTHLCRHALQVHARGKPIDEDVDLRQIARDLPGLSGAELANVLNEGALEAVRRNATSISATDIYNAVDRILQVRQGTVFTSSVNSRAYSANPFLIDPACVLSCCAFA